MNSIRMYRASTYFFRGSAIARGDQPCAIPRSRPAGERRCARPGVRLVRKLGRVWAMASWLPGGGGEAAEREVPTEGDEGRPVVGMGVLAANGEHGLPERRDAALSCEEV